MKRPLVIAYTFVLMNWAAVIGLYHFIRGHVDIWDRNRIPQSADGSPSPGRME